MVPRWIVDAFSQAQLSHIEEYLPSTVVFWTEVVKLFTSLVLVLYESGAFG